MEQFKDVMDMRRAQWQLMCARERWRHALAECSDASVVYDRTLRASLNDEDFFIDFIDDALDRHLVWHLHRSGKHLCLELSDRDNTTTIDLSWKQFDIMRLALKARGFGVEI